jgi:acyl dehydratase
MTTTTWSSKDALLYAVGIGAGTDDLAFTTENSAGIEQQVFPTFAVILETRIGRPPRFGDFDPAMLVHGSESVTIHQPLRPSGSVTAQRRVTGIYDKGKAGVATLETVGTAEDGSLLFTATMSIFVRGAGGFGGDRGPSAPDHSPPERDPDHEVTYTTRPDQALLYRLSGDRNPLHSDPSFARRAGFDRPILHGLCTYGFTGRALLSSLCEGDASRLQHIEGRFASPVFPGDPLTIRVWRTGDDTAVFTTSVADRVVLDNGLARFS